MTIEDREAIRELLAAYCEHVDVGEPEAWANLFTEDGSFVAERGTEGVGSTPVHGREALQKMGSYFRADGLHISANPRIVVDGDNATVVSYVFVLEGADAPRIRLGGRYYDQLRKVDGEWRFKSRKLVANLQLVRKGA